MDVLLLLREFGPVAGVYVFCLWSASKREDRLMKRIVQLENRMQTTLIPLVERCAATIAANTAALERFNAE